MRKIFLLIFLLVLHPTTSLSLPAFPGAEGMGADTIGGRGGTVWIVDQLGDNAAAEAAGTTFREAVTASGARYVTFAVSGIIDLESDLTISNPYLTIAGETSPGGILIASRMTAFNTHDIIVRHVRFRLGAYRITTADDAETHGDTVIINSSDVGLCYNMIFDHCSISWGFDETVSIGYDATDITFSWCFITSGLMNSVHPDSNTHSAGFFLWGRYADPEIKVSLHHSFIGYNYFRVPENNYDSFLDSVNNVIYYWYDAFTHWVEGPTGYHAKANIIGTYRKVHATQSQAHTFSAQVINYETNVQESIYMTGSLDGTRDEQTDSQWSAGEYWMDSLLSTNWQRSTPWETTGYSGTGIAVTATAMDSTYASTIVANAGATKPSRDSVDTTAASDYEAGTGGYTDAADVDTLGEFPTFSNPSAPTDSDSDGMSDAWETTTYGDLNQTSTGDEDSDGYDNIEEYFQYLTGDVASNGDITLGAGQTATLGNGVAVTIR